MLKLIKNDAYFDGEPAVRIIDMDRSSLIKVAADSRITEFASKIVPEPDKVYIHILAMGAGEYFGANRNQDYFPENNLIDWHKTFETSPAHIFRNHVNKDPKIAIGQIIFSIYNERMHRVELIGYIDRSRGGDVIDLIERGQFPATSMACKTPYDVCAVCQNRASTRQEYCEHLAGELGRIYPDGRKSMALNVAPLRFFDLSIVGRPADPTSAVLQKVAFEGNPDEVIGSAELAEIEGLTEKTANMKKLSEFIKEITDGEVVDADPDLGAILDRVKDPSHDSIEVLRNYDLKETLESLAELGMTPSLEWLAELIARKSMGSEGVGMGSLVNGYINEVGVESLPIAERDFGEPKGSPNLAIISALMPSVKQASLLPVNVVDRSLHVGPGNNTGFIGNGPRVEPDPYEMFRRNVAEPASKTPGGLTKIIKSLMVIGGAALAAKWYITQLIEQKMLANEMAKRNNEIKIQSLTKSASDYKSTYRLAKCAMHRLFVKR
jgi:hypothetical protein